MEDILFVVTILFFLDFGFLSNGETKKQRCENNGILTSFCIYFACGGLTVEFSTESVDGVQRRPNLSICEQEWMKL